MARSLAGWLGLWVTLTLSGCVHSSPHCPEEHVLPVVERGHTEPYYTSLLPDTAIDAALNDQIGAVPAYRALLERECQCLAVAGSNQAEMNSGESEVIEGRLSLLQSECSQRKRQARIRETILHYNSLEYQNRAAGTALELYYKLADMEGRWDLLQLSLFHIDDALARTRSLREQGLQLPVEYESLRRQRFDLQAEAVKVRTNIQQLNDELRRMLRLGPCHEEFRIWPAAHFEVTADCIDINAAVKEGLARRPELVLLRYLLNHLDSTTLAAIRSILQGGNNLLGLPDIRPQAVAVSLFLRIQEFICGDTREVAIRRRQLQQYLDERERIITNEIRRAVQTTEEESYLIVLARDRAASWQLKVKELEDKGNRGLASYAEIAAARQEWLKARGEVIKEVMAWEIARMQIRQAQGVLPAECEGECCCTGSSKPPAVAAPGHSNAPAAPEVLPQPQP